MKRRIKLPEAAAREVVFQPALAPLEASVLPAREGRRPAAALRHAREAFARIDAPIAPAAPVAPVAPVAPAAPATLSGRRSGSGR